MLVARAISRPDIVPPAEDIAGAFAALVGRGQQSPASDMPGMDMPAHHHHSSDQVDTLLQEGVTLQASLAVTTARVLFGLIVGLPLGMLMGLLMGWSRRADDYLHPLYVLIRSVPPLSLITYIMLWLGHSEAHRLIPIVYAVAVTMVIPTYHGVRDVAAKYVVAAQSLGARGKLLVRRVLLPAAGPGWGRTTSTTSNCCPPSGPLRRGGSSSSSRTSCWTASWSACAASCSGS